MFGVTPQKEKALARRMEELGIRDEDLDEKFIRGSGSGGQKINKTSSCVQLLHAPSGVEVKCQQTRSQALNRYYARILLCEQIAEKLLGEKSKRRQKAEKIRRQKRKRSKRAQEKMLQDKKANAKRKNLRKPPSE